jgi:FMN phosphatase YigB (HAD superfamily)
MPTTFLFDLFGVLLGADKSTLIHFIAERTNNSFETTELEFIKQFSKFEKREINFNQFFQNLQYGLKNGNQLEVEEVKSIWMQQELAELPTVNYLPILKKRYSINLISNVSNSYLNVLRNKFDFFNLFDKCITSESANSSKPSVEIFNYSLNKIGILPNEAVFIDDQKQNVISAESIGIIGHQYKSFNNFKKFIEKYV